MESAIVLACLGRPGEGTVNLSRRCPRNCTEVDSPYSLEYLISGVSFGKSNREMRIRCSYFAARAVATLDDFRILRFLYGKFLRYPNY
jgi:hypothetical protein